jgi:3D-(3,5/4)-trihydroxycyclohexane-1,2-dione acylhydrolase (decyclizing)
VERRLPTSGEIRRAVALIRSCSKPLVICGGGVRYSAAGAELAGFCARFGIPLGETQAGKGVVPWDDPLNMGGIGVTGGLAANRIARDADLVIAVGTRLGDFTTGSRNLFRNPGARVLSINVNPFDSRKMDALSIVADARESLKSLTEALATAGWKAGYRGEVQTARAEWRKEEDRLYTEDDPAGLSQVRLLGELNEKLLPKNAIVVGASGSLPGDLQRVWRTRAEDSYHMEYGFSCMGYEIAAALGARMAAPDREVFALVGDGSYVMLHSELLTAIQEDIKLHIIVFDNAGYQCIDNLQQSQGIVKFGNDLRKRDPATGRLTGSLIKVDFAKNGESYGAKGYSVTTLEQFRAAVKSALAGSVSTVIDVKVTPKSMTHDYESWWRVGTAQVSENQKVEEAARKIAREVESARKF